MKKMLLQGIGEPSGLEYFFAMYWYIVMIVIIINILIMVYINEDAKERDIDRTLWLIIVFFTGCLGCIFYLKVRGNHPRK